MRCHCFRYERWGGALAALILLSSLWGTCSEAYAFHPSEVLRYEVTWNGNQAAHGDITTKTEAGHVNVMAQAVSDGVLKSILEIWSRIQASFTESSFQPRHYNFVLKSNLGGVETVDLSFDHKTSLVQVSKRRGDRREAHAEKFSGIYDPITAVYLLRSQKDLSKPLFVDIYDGKDKARLFVTHVGEQPVQVKCGSHAAICLNLRLVKLGGDGQEIGTGRLWISNDRHRVPLLLTSNPIVGTVRFELVQMQLGEQTSQSATPTSRESLARSNHGSQR